MNKSVKNNLLYLLGGFVVAVIIYVIAYFCCANEYILPNPLKVIEKTAKTLISANFYKAFIGTMLRVLIGFVVSLIFAVAFSVLAYLSNPFSKLFSVIVAMLRSLPVLAVLLIVLTFVNRSFAPVLVCFLSLFPLLYTAFLTALKGVSNELKEMCYLYKVPVKKQVKHLYIPKILPKILLDGAGAISFGIKLTVSAEILANVYGSVGGFMKEASLYLLTAELFAITFIVCLIGILVEFIGKILSEKAEKKLL